jgi:transposase
VVAEREPPTFRMSWAGVCPTNKQSGGKRLSAHIGHGNPWLRAALIEAAHGAARRKGTFLGEQYRRLSQRIGAKKALMAVAHSILVIVYHLLKEHKEYEELGDHFVQEREHERIKKQTVRRLERLGYQVSLEPTQEVA